MAITIVTKTVKQAFLSILLIGVVSTLYWLRVLKAEGDIVRRQMSDFKTSDVENGENGIRLAASLLQTLDESYGNGDASSNAVVALSNRTHATKYVTNGYDLSLSDFQGTASDVTMESICKDAFVIALVASKPSSLERRLMIRTAWANVTAPGTMSDVKTVFILDRLSPIKDPDGTLQDTLRNERHRYGDILANDIKSRIQAGANNVTN